jgi:N-acetylglutamate synthase-like GNAT family acetyltransferase
VSRVERAVRGGIAPAGRGDTADILVFLGDADLTVSGLDSPAVRLWVQRDARGRLVGTTGFERPDGGEDVLIRSVAVHTDLRGAGVGTALAVYALERAAAEGVTRAWLFSRRSGPFWQSLGFEAADRLELARVLAATHQVGHFRETGRLDTEVAWSRTLAPSLEA